MMGYLCGNMILKKVPQRAQIMGTRTQVGPTGVLQVDISRGVPNDTIQYWHMDITDFWVFRDGNRFLAKSGAIYPIPPFVASVSGAVNLSEVGRCNFPRRPSVTLVSRLPETPSLWLVVMPGNMGGLRARRTGFSWSMPET